MGAHAVALAADVDDHGVADQAVEDGGGEGVVFEDLAPGGKRPVGGQADRPAPPNPAPNTPRNPCACSVSTVCRRRRWPTAPPPSHHDADPLVAHPPKPAGLFHPSWGSSQVAGRARHRASKRRWPRHRRLIAATNGDTGTTESTATAPPQSGWLTETCFEDTRESSPAPPGTRSRRACPSCTPGWQVTAWVALPLE